MSERFHCRGCGRDVEIEVTRCPECGAEVERVVTESGGETIEQVVSSLVEDHARFRRQMRDLGAALSEGNAAGAADLLRQFGTSLDRHVIDEEARVLRVLIDVHGTEGAADAIQTMRQHRRIRERTDDLSRAMTIATETAVATLTDLEKLLNEHFSAEERDVFPWAVESSKEPRRPTSRRSRAESDALGAGAVSARPQRNP